MEWSFNMKELEKKKAIINAKIDAICNEIKPRKKV